MIKLRIGIFLCAVLLTTGCWISRTSDSKPVVINVLDKALYDDCHIPGSIQVDFNKVDAYVKNMPKDTTIVVYCSNYACMTSHFVAKRLLEKGYTHVRVYAGGMAEWFLAGYPVKGPAESAYLRKEVLLHEEESEEIPKISVQELAELLKIV